MTEPQHIQSDGLALAVETFGEGPPLVYAHGLMGNRHIARRELAPLADRYRIVVYDQRGHGESSPVTDPSLYDAQRMAGDMAVVMDALGVERASVGGESMGAATTLCFALQWPERVEQLLLTAPAFGDRPNPGAQRMKDIGKGIAALGMAKFLQVAAEPQRTELGWPPEAITYVAEMIGSHDPHSLVTALHTLPHWVILSDLAALSKLRFPICVIAWDSDPMHPCELAQRMVAALPNARLETMPTLPAIFVDPQNVGRIYRKFLQEE